MSRLNGLEAAFLPGNAAEINKTLSTAGETSIASTYPGLPAGVACEGEVWPFGVSYHLIATLEDARRLLGPKDDAERAARSQVYFREMLDGARTKLRLGMHDRGEEYVFAGGSIHEADGGGLRRHLPLHLKVIHLPSHHIPAGESWDVTHLHTDWDGVGFREELYVMVIIEHLTVEPGAAIEVHGNAMVLEVGMIEFLKASNSTNAFEIRILPTRHYAYSQHRRSLSASGARGRDGRSGDSSKAAELVGTLFGPRLVEGAGGRDGAPGEDGCNGYDGTAGMNGGMCMLADIRIGSLSGFLPGGLRIFAQAGAGQAGGDGGCGGNGGRGGGGAPGLDAIEGLIPGGFGGPGGNGGAGGNGGRGGNGGLASNIFIKVPAQVVECLDMCSLESQGGLGGASGRGGRGGDGGRHGAFADTSEGEISACPGADGSDGKAGASGKARPAAKMHLFPAP